MLKINGRPSSAAGITLTEYLEQAGIDPARIAVELDGEIIPRADYAHTRLEDGQELEIVSFVGGG